MNEKKQGSEETLYGWNQKQLGLILRTVAKDATLDELTLFLYTADKLGLDPLAKQIHFVKRGGSATYQVGIDGFRAVAERSGELAGIDDAVFNSEDDKQPIKATVTVYRIVKGHRVPFTASARMDEYKPSGNQAFMWNKMPYLMLSKCAESLALRKAFPNDLSGVYTDVEMDKTNEEGKIIEVEPPTPKDQVEPKKDLAKEAKIDQLNKKLEEAKNK